MDSKANALTATLSLAVYLFFFVTFVAWFVFLVPSQFVPSILKLIAPNNMDTVPVSDNAKRAITMDLLLLMAFAVPHSILARPSVKKLMGLPTCLERSFFVLQAAIFMRLQTRHWQNFDGPVIWDYQDAQVISAAILVFFVFGFAFVLTASFALDHFHLFGLTQGFGVDFNAKLGLKAKTSSNGLAVRWHYSLVAHPIMTGLLVALWATPIMTAPRLLLSLVYTSYILVAVIKLEEPTLDDLIGPAYRKYRSTVPRFIPFTTPPQGADVVKME